jgi:hypothetical protein
MKPQDHADARDQSGPHNARFMATSSCEEVYNLTEQDIRCEIAIISVASIVVKCRISSLAHRTMGPVWALEQCCFCWVVSFAASSFVSGAPWGCLPLYRLWQWRYIAFFWEPCWEQVQVKTGYQVTRNCCAILITSGWLDTR